jgi:hypothetical protein
MAVILAVGTVLNPIGLGPVLDVEVENATGDPV